MRPEPSPAAAFALAPARVHEAEGAGRRVFALWQAARLAGPLVWILPAHAPERLLPQALPPGVAERLLLVRAKGETELLWSVEESLRAAAVALVVAEPEKPLGLIASRRLQLAAEAGGTTGLLLTREGGGGAAAETRWRCDPLPASSPPAADPPAPDSTLHRWSRIKNKRGTLGDWTLCWNGTTASVHLAAATGERHGPAQPPR